MHLANGSSFQPDMVSSGSGKVKEPENPKEVESLAKKVANEVDTIDKVKIFTPDFHLHFL